MPNRSWPFAWLRESTQTGLSKGSKVFENTRKFLWMAMLWCVLLKRFASRSVWSLTSHFKTKRLAQRLYGAKQRCWRTYTGNEIRNKTCLINFCFFAFLLMIYSLFIFIFCRCAVIFSPAYISQLNEFYFSWIFYMFSVFRVTDRFLKIKSCAIFKSWWKGYLEIKRIFRFFNNNKKRSTH